MEIHILFILLISAGLALGIYGVVIQQGANLVRMDLRTTLIAVLWGALELAVTFAGCRIGKWLLLFETERHHSVFWVNLLAGLILAGIGVRMLFKAFRKKTFLEHRMEQLDIREDLLPTLRLFVSGLLAGVACGLLEYDLPVVLISAFVISVVSSVGGYVSGQIWGPAPCRKAFGIGGCLLFLVAIALQVVRFV